MEGIQLSSSSEDPVMFFQAYTQVPKALNGRFTPRLLGHDCRLLLIGHGGSSYAFVKGIRHGEEGSSGSWGQS